MILLRLAPGVTAEFPADGGVMVADPRGRFPIRHAAAVRLIRTGACWADLHRLDDPAGARAAALRLLRAGAAVLVCGETAAAPAVAVARLTTRLSRYRPSDGVPAQQRFRLSRFALLRRHGDDMALESPVAGCRVTLADPRAAALVASLARPRTSAELRAASPVPAGTADALLHLLADLRLACPVDADGLLAEDTDPVTAQREVHDVWAHARARAGLTDTPVGATFRFAGRFPPEPATRPEPGGAEPVRLPRPDTARLVAEDPPLAEVMERRRSVRAFGPAPLSMAQVGELLHRVARVVRAMPPDPAAGLPYEHTYRPVPSAGAVHELEYYLVSRACAGLVPGLYRYEPAEHALTPIDADLRRPAAAIEVARTGIGAVSPPQALIVLAARFTRSGWKYEGIARTLTLMNAGVALHAVHLCATAMGLGACAVGAGDSALFAEMTGLDPLAESSVAEIAVGTLPRPPLQEEIR
ncbi:SagB family peptide dehydrogenase [Spongiactinospora sp. TRM90649]|uniref:SagB family peptide dehydrogenase n=1 Tax=Spongiactinospora sp. TRM90649 TaxID=3031114 RepID=UPI0023F9B53E|nr:SagB family peptide dehydrogenase [Spongiactinospora sp. TRM90649]MDF5757589.1 SagB family peptide dehydrogenase [Spongiactinospora sp. TRM90649]